MDTLSSHEVSPPRSELSCPLTSRETPTGQVICGAGGGAGGGGGGGSEGGEGGALGGGAGGCGGGGE